MSENAREPQVLDTIGKGGNYWRIENIDEKGSITAWRIYDGTIVKKGRPLRINVEKIKDGTYRLLHLPPVTVSHVEPEKYEPQKVVPAPERCEEPETEPEPEPPASLLMEDYLDMKFRLEERIEFLDIALDKAQKENEELKRKLEAVTNDMAILQVKERNTSAEKAKAEGQVTGLMAAMNLLIHGQGAKG